MRSEMAPKSETSRRDQELEPELVEMQAAPAVERQEVELRVVVWPVVEKPEEEMLEEEMPVVGRLVGELPEVGWREGEMIREEELKLGVVPRLRGVVQRWEEGWLVERVVGCCWVVELWGLPVELWGSPVEQGCWWWVTWQEIGLRHRRRQCR